MKSSRRDFLKTSAVAVATISASIQAQEGAKMKKYGVGILGNCCTHGAGLCGMFKGRPDTQVIAAYEKNPKRAKELADTLSASLAGSYEEVIAAPGVEIIAISSDPCDKADLAEKAAAAGKHLFINKPFCDNLDHARRIAKAAQEHKVWLAHDIPMVRFIPVYARLLEEVHAGKYGTVMGYHHLFGMNFAPDFDLKTVWPERLDPPEKSGGGEMTNMGCYAIDFAVSLFGLPKTVTAKCRKTWDVYAAANTENFGQVVLDYGDFFAFLEMGKQQLQGELRHSNCLTINFEHETFHIDASAQQVAVNHVPRDFNEFAAGATAAGAVEQLLLAIEKNIPPTSNAETAVMATETLMAAYQSIVEGKTIRLPLASGENPLARKKTT
ncbi:MAG TPA: Gfo/Idh/MocA family oxidoreductase [Candidatus Hydrogenedentes bacterium]|nr:Gfo/Idh/MocA family oxidoreductase [Candidatus Hydrogenedentota bacterium]